MIFYYVDTQQIEKELNLYKEILSKFSNNPKILNMYAWRMAEIEINLEDALAKAQKAIYLMNDDPKRANIIDTDAEIFWKMKQYDNAIKTIDLAIQLNPQNQYYKDQREKFLDFRTGKIAEFCLQLHIKSGKKVEKFLDFGAAGMCKFQRKIILSEKFF